MINVSYIRVSWLIFKYEVTQIHFEYINQYSFHENIVYNVTFAKENFQENIQKVSENNSIFKNSFSRFCKKIIKNFLK